MSWSELRLLGNRVLVKLDPRETMHGGLIVIPDTAQRQPEFATVITCGPGGYTKDNRWVPMDVAPGERVLIGKWNGTRLEAPVHDPRGEYFVMNVDQDLRIQDIYGVEDRT